MDDSKGCYYVCEGYHKVYLGEWVTVFIYSTSEGVRLVGHRVV